MYSPLSITSKKSKLYAINILLEMAKEDSELSKFSDEKFYERIDRLKKSEVEPSIVIEFLKNIKISPRLEYLFRSFDRELVKRFEHSNLLWIIPYKDIKMTRVYKERDLDVLEIVYYSHLLSTTRLFRMKHDGEIYELINQLCLFNGNYRC
ncbi:MAG: hypothetical protein J7L82_05575 [Staphylothermus sp.]|nr:hypothetical protein [Staphylothermus sp.]